MPLTIYGGPLSPFVARVALAARFKGFKYGLTLPPDGIKTPAYLKLNPFGKVPVLKDGKTVLFESTVIVEYLEAKGRTKKLVPKSAKAGAEARLIGTLATEYIQGAVGKLTPFVREPGADPKLMEEPAAKLAEYLDILERTVPRGKYAAGNRFSIADVYVAPTLMFASLVNQHLGLQDITTGRPKLKKYLAAMQKDKISSDVLKAMAAEWKRRFPT